MPTSPFRRWLRRAPIRYRRPLAAVSAFASVLLTIAALQPPTAVGDQSAATQAHSASASSTITPPPGFVAAPVRLADADVARLLTRGSTVDVLAADGAGRATVVASAVRVLAIPVTPADGFGGDGFGGALVVLAVSTDQAVQLAAEAAVGPVSVVLH